MTVSACLANQSAVQGVRENACVREKKSKGSLSPRVCVLDVNASSHLATRGK
jgi:hypothetical protein